MNGRHESTKPHGSGGRRAVLWLLLPPLLVLIVLETDFLPQAARCLDSSARGQQQSLDTEKPESAKVYAVLCSHYAAVFALICGSTNNEQANLQLQQSSLGLLLNGWRLARPRQIRQSLCRLLFHLPSRGFHDNNPALHAKVGARDHVEDSRGRDQILSAGAAQFRYPTTVHSSARRAGGDLLHGRLRQELLHAMSDVIVPLYITAHEYDGRVQLLITDYNAEWGAKFRPILAALSVYPVIHFDADTAVRCFPSAHVGLESHRVLGIDPARSRKGYTMMGFRDFLRSVFSLQRPWTPPASRSSGQKPRLVFVLRRHSRAVTNEAEAVAALADVGFEVVAAGPEDVSDMARFAAVVNSCDVMVGVHGAGLTNMVFLPHNGTVVQIIPWGKLKYPCRFDFGDPVPDMGLRYEEYEVTAEETTLKDTYPRDHPVFADPLSIEREGKVWEVFLDGQNVTLDIDRFRGAMQQIYQSITTE
ncbi:hypothetical protein C2845_PM09G14520 [Panicum miliaceum]|uniref:Glycosyltransferase 61 catalytic domain-containing protein n=1 Tax=Panicum miliaceum TaxID=4540 RepID=A0A3L6S3J3_PANMI|nr:hypothetical protein C2845_PM09G14520 [Panicum miliaceum]